MNSYENGREFMIGRKVYTIQRSLTDGLWDVEIGKFGWVSTGYPADYSAEQAEARFREDFRGGANKWVNKRIREAAT